MAGLPPRATRTRWPPGCACRRRSGRGCPPLRPPPSRARVAVREEQPVGVHDHSGRAEAALETALIDERLLDGVELAGLRQAFDGGDVLAWTSASEDRQERTDFPPTTTVQEPQSPTPQPYFVPVSPRSVRRAQRRERWSSVSKRTGLPFKVKVTARAWGPLLSRRGRAVRLIRPRTGPVNENRWAGRAARHQRHSWDAEPLRYGPAWRTSSTRPTGSSRRAPGLRPRASPAQDRRAAPPRASTPGVPLERPPPRCHLVDHRPEGEDVGTRVAGPSGRRACPSGCPGPCRRRPLPPSPSFSRIV